MVRIEIVDQGSGIAPEHLHAVFDPFFTTKKRGEGTGLGLPIAASIVRNHGGRIDLASTPRPGDDRDRALAGGRPARTRRRHDGRRGKLRVLVVDDVVDMARTIANDLDAAGFDDRDRRQRRRRAGARSPGSPPTSS